MAVKSKNVSTIGELMTRDPVCVSPDASLQELAEVLEGNSISGVPVIDVSGRLIGVVSRTDLLRRCVEGPIGSRPGQFERRAASLAEGMAAWAEDLGIVEDIMNTDLITVTADAKPADVARKMAEESVHRVIVVEGDRGVAGIVTSLDLLRIFPG